MAIVLYALTALLYCGLAYHGWATRNPQLSAAGNGGAIGGAAATALLHGGGGPGG
ncbi:MAG: inner membrane protein YpjD, partial [Cupriavidus basilensis]|nr:inner membrane protein YpjD [Cupriavidus basilensis]